MTKSVMDHTVEMVGEVVRREFSKDLRVVVVTCKGFAGFENAVASVTKRLPKSSLPAYAVRTALRGCEILRLPFFDIEFRERGGSGRLEVTGPLEASKRLVLQMGELPCEASSG